MPIKHFELSAIDGKRFSKSTEKIRNVRIDHNSSVTLISVIDDKQANIDFRFTANYSGLGFIKIEGHIIFEGDAPTLAREWQTNGRMPDDVANEIHRMVITNCIPDAVLVAKELRLPPPIPIPQVNVKGGKVKPSSGIEVA